jgi:O-antigen ligase
MITFIQILLCLLVVSLSAFPKLVPVLIYLLGFLAIYFFFKKKKNIVNYSYRMILPIGFFLVYLLSIVFSNDQKEALGVLESKVSFLFLPFVFMVFSKEQINTQKLLTYFTWANVLIVLILFLRSLYAYLYDVYVPEHNTMLGKVHFTQSHFSLIIHPSYFAMYLTFSLVYIADQIFKHRLNIVRSFQIATILLGLYCCDSMLSNIVTLILIVLIILRTAWLKSIVFNHWKSISSIVVLTSLVLIGIYQSEIRSSIQTYYISIDKSTTTSIDARILIWKTVVFDVFPESGLLGLGSGDVKEVLTQAYKKNQFTGCYQRQFNAHNQFLQTSISLGILGFLSICSLILLPLGWFLKNKSFLGFCFSVIIFLNLLTESMFERQAGVVFFVLFYLLMNRSKNS